MLTHVAPFQKLYCLCEKGLFYSSAFQFMKNITFRSDALHVLFCIFLCLEGATTYCSYHHHHHQGLDPLIRSVSKVSMPIDNIHKYWETPSDMTSVSSASKTDFLTSSLVIPGQCNFSCSTEERMKASSRLLKTETFG